MVIMETKRKIRNNHRKGEGIRSLSRRFNMSRKTIKGIINEEGQIKSSYSRVSQPYKALEGYISTLEKLLRDNQKVKPKLTDKHMYERLESEGYKGSYSAVNRYSLKWKSKNSLSFSSACVPLLFAPGEAYQFDWSTDYVFIRGERLKVKVAHFVLCYSGKRFLYVYPNETQEMVFDSHVRAFEFFGGTPIRGIYDNMKTAVSQVLRGSGRVWNPKFEHLCAHYRIEPTACTPARGNEKGRVERAVGIDRQQFFTPTPEGNTLQEINDILLSQLIVYNKTHKHPEYKDKTIDEVFEDERLCLLPAPVLFDGCKEISVRVSTTCLAQHDRNNYSVSCICAGKIVECKIYADKLIFVYEGKIVAEHERQFTRGKTYYNYIHYLPILSRKPGALKNGAPFINMILPESLCKVRDHLEKKEAGSKDFAHILSYIPRESMKVVVSACDEAIKAKTISKDVIINILSRKKDVQEPPIVQAPIKLNHAVEAKCSVYNELLSKKVSS